MFEWIDHVAAAWALTGWRHAALRWTLQASVALLALLLGWWVVRHVRKLVRKAVLLRGGDAALAGFLGTVAATALGLVVVVAALDAVGIPTASLLAALGAAGLAIGLAIRESLSNLAAGVLLVVTRPFRAGNFVEAAGRRGTVDRLELLQTVLITTDNCEVFIPNNQVMTAPIVNFSAREERRLELTLALDAAADPVRGLEVLDATVRAHPRVLREREPQILIQRIHDGVIDVLVRPWVRTSEVLVAQSELLAALKRALEEAGITLAQRPLAPSPITAAATPVRRANEPI